MNKTQLFVEKSNNVHSNKFTYTNVVYVNAKTKVTITCKDHGDFNQIPNSHLNGSGCPMCASIKHSKNTALTTDEFIRRSSKKHNNKYSYKKSVYTTANSLITITCPIHGDFEQAAVSHYHTGNGCPYCAGSKQTTELFICKSANIHNNKYDYNNVIYKNSHTKVIITCPIHGDFEQTPSNHYKHGCALCNRLGGYDELYFENKPHKKEMPAVLYLVKFYNDVEEFWKIGITVRKICERFASVRNYQYNIIDVVECDLYDAFTREQKLLRENTHLQYWPKHHIDGYTECLQEPIVLI